MFQWLKNLVRPAKEDQLSGLALVQRFSTDDEPKVVDYPRGAYHAYWEILLGEVPGGYIANVRFYSYADGVILAEFQHIQPTVGKLKAQVNQCVRDQMAQYKR